jgi:TP901 family phage tail tape measure protein
MTKQIEDLAMASGTSASEISTEFVRAVEIFGLSGNEVQRLASATFALGRANAASIPQILLMSNRLAGVADAAGLSTQETLAFATVVSGLGNQARSGPAALIRVLGTMNDAIDLQSDKLTSLAAVSGKTTEEFVQDFRSNRLKGSG